ncbi:MAG: glucosidase [Chitinophagaceae bacterium]|nr:glucosidase [Chitinophagaceae bacterium]
MNKEKERLQDAGWKKWGSYVSARQWGTVREDYSANGDAWNFTTHEMARSKAWRWGEEAIAGICDEFQLLCFGLALWNKRDTILKERLFGLNNDEGNHGEDVKEVYYYLDATPTHSYMKMLYKYPQEEFPYNLLVAENRRRGREQGEFELMDTGIFDDDRYFDVFVEYAKAGKEDLLIRITVHNRGKETASLHVLPTLWFRNTWGWGANNYKPSLSQTGDHCIAIDHEQLAVKHLYYEQGDAWFCENETNNEKLYKSANSSPYPKDGINDYLLHGQNTINPSNRGTKAAVNRDITIEAGKSFTIKLRLTDKSPEQPFSDFDTLFEKRMAEADAFYAEVQQDVKDEEERNIQRQAFAGMLWNKQFYYYLVEQWLEGDPGLPRPPRERWHQRNANWTHVTNMDIISVPDKWEFPWYAAWDLSFHCITLAMVDPDFAKEQLLLFTREWYMNPDGAFPAYEWAFSDVNPPVHAVGAIRVFRQDAAIKGKKDYLFLEEVFQKLLINFTWWVNRKDTKSKNIFEGGFLGLDNISVFDRSTPMPGNAVMEQADATSWMAMYALNMLHIALELATNNEAYTGMTTKFFEHFMYIAGAMDSMGEGHNGLWDEEDEFFYDQVRMPDNEVIKVRLRSLVGLIPLFAVEVITREILDSNPVFAERMAWFLEHRPDLAALVSRWYEGNAENKRLLSLLRGHRMKRLLNRALDETEFLSPYGIRSLSRKYENIPYRIDWSDPSEPIYYIPGESNSGMYGGNSNWRGPVWMQMNFLIIESLRKFHFFYTDDFKIEYPTASGNYLSLKEVGTELANRLLKIFKKDENGKRPLYGNNKKLQDDPHFNPYFLFFEYFHGNTGEGLGASHQTGWTGLIANLITMKNKDQA